ncbi:MAG: hypothetical protein WCQ57_00295 [Verrucomicrobiota bacterium]
MVNSTLIPRPDLLDERSPVGLEVYQIRSDPGLPACHISMEAQVFTPDSAYFVLHHGVGVQSYDHKAPQHQLLLCEAATGELTTLSDEVGVVAPVVSPDGRHLYYFVDETLPGTGRLTLKRRRIDGSEAETLAVLDSEIPGTKFRASKPGHLSTIRSDGKALALYCFLGDGIHPGGAYGLLIFHLENGGCDLVFHGRSFWNMHIQYCRSSDEVHKHDILIQENHGNFITADGTPRHRGWGRGADIHVIRDDGQHLRNMPWGKVDGERCSGHQCWRGQTNFAIASIVVGDDDALREKRSELHLMESLPVPHYGHDGARASDAVRNRLSREFSPAHFNHFATDLAGRRLIADYRPSWDTDVLMKDTIYLMDLGEPGVDAARNITYLFSSGSSWLQSAHVHPFFSPNGEIALFNSDESGQTQAYLIRSLPPYAEENRGGI